MDPSQLFMQHLYHLARQTSQKAINPEDIEEIIVDDCVAFEMEPVDEEWVHFISVRAVNTGNGDGGKALKKVMNIADSCGTYLLGRIIPYDKKTLSKDRLRSWYRKHGCKPIQDNNPDGLWVRIPRSKVHKLPKLDLKNKIKVYKGLSGEDFQAHLNFFKVVAGLFALWLIKRK